MANTVHHHTHEKDHTKKEIAIWVMGAACAVAGAWIAGNLRGGLGVSQAGILVGLVASFLLFLLAGFFWISVAASIKNA